MNDEQHYHQEDPLQGCGLMIMGACLLLSLLIFVSLFIVLFVK